MIGCNCGGFTVRKQAAAGSKTLSWEQCGACGRCDAWKLRDGKAIVAHGEAARRQFRDETRHKHD